MLPKRIFHSVTFELFVLVSLVMLDQWTKQRFQDMGKVFMNPGGFLGILPEFWWFTGLLVVWLGLVYHWFLFRWGWHRFGLLLILTGGLGNLVDRLIIGSVRDFIYYPVFGFYGNLADIYLVAGVCICLVSSLLLQYKPCSPPPNNQ